MDGKNKKIMLKEIVPYIAAVVIVMIMIAFMGIFLWNSKDDVVTEKTVQRYLKDYYGEITQEMKVLSKNMSDELDSSLAEMDTRELTKEELQQLLDIVNSELCKATYNISQEEINKLAKQIVQKVLETHIGTDTELLEKYASQLDALSGKVVALEKKMLLIKNYTEDDIKNIAKSLDLTEAQVVTLIKKYSTTTSASLDGLAKELNISVEELKKMIAESREYTDSLYIKLSKQFNTSAAELKKLSKQVNINTEEIDEIAKKLGITSEQLYDAILDSGELTRSEIEKLASKLNKNVTELSSMIDQNKELTGTGIDELAQELNISKTEIYGHFNVLNASVSEIRQLIEMSDGELRALAEKMNLSDEELRTLIGTLENELTDNYAELKNTVVTRDALAEAQESIRNSLSAEADEREAAVNKAIADLNAAINLSEGEDAKKLQDARDELQDSLTNGMGNIENALNNANAQINSYLNNLDVEIDKLNGAITKVNSSIDDIVGKVARNSDNIANLGEQVTNNYTELRTTTAKNSDNIASLGEQVTNNYTELKTTTATKDALQQVHDSMKEGLDAESEKRESAISGLGSTKAEIHYFEDNGVPTLTIDSVIRD